MAHFSELNNNIDVSKVMVSQASRINEFPVKTDLYVELRGLDRLRCLFEQVLLYFNKDLIRAFPPKLCDGVEVDLFTLFWVIRKIGDYESVSNTNLWEFVAKECGLDIIHVGALKLIYIKHLKEFDQWLIRCGFNDTTLKSAELGALEKLESLFHELRWCSNTSSSVGFDDGKSLLNEKMDFDMVKLEMGLSRINNGNENHDDITGLDLNVAINEEVGGLNLNMANVDGGFSRMNNVDEKVEIFGGLDERRLEFCPIIDNDKRGVLCSINMHGLHANNSEIKINGDNDDNMVILAKTIVTNVVDSQKMVKDESFSSKRMKKEQSLLLSKNERGFSRINNVFNEKREEIGGLDLGLAKIEMLYPRIKDDNNTNVLCPMNAPDFHSDNSDHNDNHDDSALIIAKTIISKVVGSRKRIKEESCSSQNMKKQNMKKEESLSLSEVLDWVANAARNPHDDEIGIVPNSSKWKKCKGNKVWKQVLLVKETLSVKRNVDSGYKFYGSQKKRIMMHPSMYEDDKIPVHLSSKRKRFSQRVSYVKSCSCPGCTSCPSSLNKCVKKVPHILDPMEIHDDTCEDLEAESVNVRADVPKWTSVVFESDSKWLGTRMWPPPEGDSGKREMENLVIGKGRQNSCTCPIPGSADCVRFHISENRTKIKDTLGPLFYKWKFDRMGEEASASLWSPEEETEFKSLVSKARQDLSDRSKSRHEIMSYFWRRAFESIPFKTKDMLVSYYYNVFVLRRRSYQNRIMPDNIDSDDDEHDVGYVGDVIGNVKICALSVKCSGNSALIES
ncbi:AT-rich interactive domain-containing protein 2-like [Rutidosis leptorrhynchoides]|uniref:AT-rich interactive domain-containing protein 2-like n=1 Tax=Rutidosis leptorrhynchoides TaxID=125765 RepID=UPI003A994D35